VISVCRTSWNVVTRITSQSRKDVLQSSSVFCDSKSVKLYTHVFVRVVVLHVALLRHGRFLYDCVLQFIVHNAVKSMFINIVFCRTVELCFLLSCCARKLILFHDPGIYFLHILMHFIDSSFMICVESTVF
jgi:hypothetical protein